MATVLSVVEEAHQRSLLIVGHVVIRIVLEKDVVSNCLAKRFQGVRIGEEKAVAFSRFHNKVRVQ